MARFSIRRRQAACAALIVAALSSAPAGAAVYQITNLNDVVWNTLGQAAKFVPTGINDFGTIIGTAWGGQLDRSVVALVNPGLTGVTTYKAGNDGGGHAIQIEGYKVNNKNDFVGDAYTFTGPVTSSQKESLIYVQSDGFGHILNVAGSDNRALGINDSKAVVGNVEAVNYASNPPFDIAATTQIPELSGANYSLADINDNGVIVGTKDANLFQGGEGFVDNHGVITTFGYPGAKYTYANGISNSGVIVGTWYDAQGYAHGYVDDDGQFSNVSLPGNISVYLEGINDVGQIVGEYANYTSATMDGFLLTPLQRSCDAVCLIGLLPQTGPRRERVDPGEFAWAPLKEFVETSVAEPPPWPSFDASVIADVQASQFSAPESSTWAMMLLGFAAMVFRSASQDTLGSLNYLIAGGLSQGRKGRHRQSTAYAAPSAAFARSARLRSFGSSSAFLSRIDFGVTSTSSSSWI